MIHTIYFDPSLEGPLTWAKNRGKLAGFFEFVTFDPMSEEYEMSQVSGEQWLARIEKENSDFLVDVDPEIVYSLRRLKESIEKRRKL